MASSRDHHPSSSASLYICCRMCVVVRSSVIHCCGNVYYPLGTARGRLVALSVSTCSCLSAVCGHKNEHIANNCCLFNKQKTNESQQARINKCRSQSTQCHVKVDQLELLTCPQSRLHSLACRVSLHSSAAAECP